MQDYHNGGPEQGGGYLQELGYGAHHLSVGRATGSEYGNSQAQFPATRAQFVVSEIYGAGRQAAFFV